MQLKKIILNLEDEIDLKTWSSLNKSHNSYNDIKFYLLHDEENPKIKYVIYMFNEDSKIIKDKKDKTMKQSEFQQTVLTAIGKINIKIGSVYFLRVLEKTKKHFFFTPIILLYFYWKSIIKNKIILVKLVCNC